MKGGAKQPTSSESRLLGSLAPPLVQLPPCPFTALQYSKWPISSEKATLYECAAHTTRVASLEVAYAGWNGAWVTVHVVALGLKFTCPNPFATLAFMEPEVPLV